MARIETDPNYSSPTFSRATASTDLFKKEDVQALAAAVSTHDHTTGKGAVLAAGSFPAGSITSGMIADGTIVAGDIADGAVTSAKILDGTIATADHADASVTNAKLASDTARANLLTNGGFEIWQRGNGPFTGGFAADRWQPNVAAGDTFSVSRDTANVDTGSGACMVCTYTRSTGGSYVSHVFAAEVTPLKGRTVAFSLRVKTSTATAVRLRANDAIGGAQFSAYHTGGGTYETLTMTYVVAASAATFSAGAVFDASCTAYIDNAMLVVGSVAADYAPLHPADDLACCLRYYEVLGGVAGGYPGVVGYGVAGAVVGAPIGWKATKSVTPTITKTGTWTVASCTQPLADRNTAQGFRFYTSVTVVGNFETFPADATCTVVGEANP